MTTPSPFTVQSATPFDPAFPLYSVGAAAWQWDFNGWKTESLSWKRGCYIHGGLSGPGQLRFHGPDAEQFLSSIFVNNFSRFKSGAAKHAIACDDRGLIVGHGVLERFAADDFRLFVSGGWAAYMHSKTDLDVTLEVQNNYLFQVAGPESRKALEAACGEDISDVAFLRFRTITIAGRKAELMRIGMAGTLAYELHGPIDDGPSVYQAVFEAGKPHGIERLGWKTYTVNHIEGGFPQQTWTFLPATYDNSDFLSFPAPGYRVGPALPVFNGSVDPSNLRARYRTPQEVGWGRSIQFDHDFVGRAALEEEMRAPKRTIVTLVWNAEDVVDIYASLFRKGEEYKHIDLPTTPPLIGPSGLADHILKDGEEVGISSGVAYSYRFREMLSHGTIDIDAAEIGTEVVVRWGDHGGRIKDVRARVERFPYLSEERNQTV